MQQIRTFTGPRASAQRHWQRGRALAQQLQWAPACTAFEQAVALAPGDTVYRLNLAHAALRAGRDDTCEPAAREVLAGEPTNALALRLLAESLARQHRHAEAARCWGELEALGHADAEVLQRRAMAELGAMRPAPACELLLRALSLEPTRVQVYALLAEALRDRGLKQEAAECMRTVIALQPQHVEMRARLSFEKRHLMDWSDLADDTALLRDAIGALPEAAAQPCGSFGLLSLPLDPALTLRAARAESRSLCQGVQPLPPLQPGQRRAGRIRVGWLGYDFRDHPVAQLLVQTLELLDRSRFEVFVYSTGPDDSSALRSRVFAAADLAADLAASSDTQAAERIRADGVDLLVDLMGHTRGVRMGILARRPAPVQLGFLGYPSSTGCEAIDYIVGDPFVTPVDLAHLYTEKLAQLPLCFQPNDRQRPRPQPMTRAEAGLPEDAFVLCAFNHSYKVLPETFDAWCTVLREVPHAVLWLRDTGTQMHAQARREATARGVDPARVIFAPRVPYEQHFSRLALADVFADTWPYNAHTTASDALWAGVPVVTRYGNSYASRVAASVLNACGLAELAFETPEDYTRALLALATEPALGQAYREHLQTQRDALPLFDTPRYADELGALLERMAQRWQQGLAPDHLLA
jgi:predicted O-linked N-acetylglucosamine transferase (SPINDLY family)